MIVPVQMCWLAVVAEEKCRYMAVQVQTSLVAVGATQLEDSFVQAQKSWLVAVDTVAAVTVVDIVGIVGIVVVHSPEDTPVAVAPQKSYVIAAVAIAPIAAVVDTTVPLADTADTVDMLRMVLALVQSP